ncbi:inositol monophosphatase family protein [Streptomyces kronopolitis]|uniref:inositol monophosphatase family protein n=1 Tax=Streptomyces kronopolitis TaxID=1612435 RepID=UPI00343B02B6
MNDAVPTGALSLADVLHPVLDEAAGEIAAFRSRDPAQVVRHKRSVHGGTEPVTELDLRLQDMLTDALRKAWPEVPVVAEERRHHTLEELPDDCVLLDPLDGTDPFLNGSTHFAITACRIEAGFPVQGIVDLPAHRVRVDIDRAALTITGDVERLPSFAPETLLTSPRHLDRARQLLPGRPVAAVPTASVKMTLVALGRATAAAYLPGAHGGAAPWDYASAALAVHTAGGKAIAPDGRDLAHSRPRIHPGWLATRHAPAAADLAPLMHPHS